SDGSREQRPLTVDKTGRQVIVDAQTEVSGVLTVQAGLSFRESTAAKAAVATPSAAAAAPAAPTPVWGIRRVPAVSRNGSELRIELDATNGTSSVVIGAWTLPTTPPSGHKPRPSFNPLLTVASDRSVTVHGDLRVAGTIRSTFSRVLSDYSA